MTNDIKTAADRIVEKYRPHAKTWDCWNDEPDEQNHPTKCAILEVEACIELMHSFGGDLFPITIERYGMIRQELKSRIV